MVESLTTTAGVDNSVSDTGSLIVNVRWLRTALPLVLAIVVVLYQIGVAQSLERNFGHFVHYSVEIAFYSLTGPIATWLMLGWVERNLREKARLEQVAHRLNLERANVIEEERERISRDLHDNVAQTLYFMALKADLGGQLLSQQPEKVAEILREIGEGTRHVIRDVRLTIFALHPFRWTNENFLIGLQEFARAFAEQAGWELSASLPPDPRIIPPSYQSTIYRLVNESLVNVAKHANAKHVAIKVDLIHSKECLSIQVIDDGQGFSPDENVRGGVGLQQLRSRVAALNGRFDITSEPGKGTTVHFELPIVEGNHE